MSNAKTLAKAAGIYAASAALNVGASACEGIHTTSTKGCQKLGTVISKLEKTHDAIVNPKK